MIPFIEGLIMTLHTCKECEHFTPYYTKFKHYHMMEVNCGRCKKLHTNKKGIKKGNQTACACFSVRNTEKEKELQNLSLKKMIINMHENLQKIIEVLES